MRKKRTSYKEETPSPPRPITPLGASYLPPTPPPDVPKPRKPKKTPRKEVRRELVPGYQSIGAFLSTVRDYTTQEFMATTPGYTEVPYFQEFDAVDGIEVLRDIFNRLNKEFQDRNEIHWILTSRWEGRFPELHTFLIACGIWTFILLHSEETREGKSGATNHQKTETSGTVSFTVQDPEYYMKLVVNGKTFKIGARQGKAIKWLHESHKNGSPCVPDGKLRTVMGLPSTSRIKDSFKGKTSKLLWKVLIIREGRTLRLNI